MKRLYSKKINSTKENVSGYGCGGWDCKGTCLFNCQGICKTNCAVMCSWTCRNNCVTSCRGYHY